MFDYHDGLFAIKAAADNPQLVQAHEFIASQDAVLEENRQAALAEANKNHTKEIKKARANRDRTLASFKSVSLRREAV